MDSHLDRRWVVETPEGSWSLVEGYETVTDAIRVGRTMHTGDFRVGKARLCRTGEFTKELGAALLDAATEVAVNVVGNAAEDWLWPGTCAAVDLDRRVKDMLDGWVREHKLQPTFHVVDDVREIKAL